MEHSLHRHGSLPSVQSLASAEPVEIAASREALPTATPPAEPAIAEVRFGSIAPWYHTLGIVLLLLVYSFVSHLTHQHGGSSASSSRMEQTVSETARAFAETPKVPLYGSTMMLSWMLLASVVAGLYRRRAFFLATLRRRFRSRWVDAALGLAIYLSFLTTLSMLVLLFTSLLMAREHHTHAKLNGGSAQTQAAGEHGNKGAEDSYATAANEAQAVQQRVQRMLHVNREAVASLAPQTLPQLLVWIALSCTAGFCEEHIFRGYLLRQSLAAMHGLAVPPWLAATLSVLATSALFGSLHLYEGVGGAVIVGLLGAVFATMTLVLGNLRAVIIAHFLQDFLGGLFYYTAHLRHAL